MRTYKFYQDIKVSVWKRQYFEIEAASEQEAKRIAMKFKDCDVSEDEEYTRTETMYETEEKMTVDENGGSDTIQLYLRGEEHPFATNGNEEIKRMIASFDQFKDARQVAYRDMANYVIESSDSLGSGFYSAFHADKKLNVVVIYCDNTAERYCFKESWHELTGQNEAFRKKMADYLIGKNEKDAPFVHDWLAGHLTEMENTSDAVENKAPFDLFDLIKVWGGQVEKKTYQPAALIGYQVVNDKDELPEGLCANDVIREKQDALHRLAKAREREPDSGFDIFPVYENEILDPSFK